MANERNSMYYLNTGYIGDDDEYYREEHGNNRMVQDVVVDLERSHPHDLQLPSSRASSVSYQSSDDNDEIKDRELIVDNLDIVDLLPSRQLGSTIAGVASSEDWIKYRRESRKSRKKQSGTGKTDEAAERIIHSAELMGNSLKSTLRRRRTVRGLTGSIKTKKKVRDTIDRKKRRSQQKVNCFTVMWYSFTLSLVKLKDDIWDWFQDLEPWKEIIKKIEGNFGSGVTSYFIFLRWMLYLNIVVFLFSFGFMTIPQFVHEPSWQHNNASFGGWELLTGEGWFEETELYMGYYTNEDIKGVYNMPLAYLFTTGGFSLIILIVITQSMSREYRKSYAFGTGGINFYVNKIFCSWDYSITSKTTAKLKHKSIYLEMSEQLERQREQEEKSWTHLCQLWLIRILFWLIDLVLVAGACAAIYYTYESDFVQNIIDDPNSAGWNTLSLLFVPLLVSSFNLLLPLIFGLFLSLEKYDNPRIGLYISLFRTMLLKTSILGTLLYFWYTAVQTCQAAAAASDTTTISAIPDTQFLNATVTEVPGDNATTLGAATSTNGIPATTNGIPATTNSSSTTSSSCVECWETNLGMEVYRLVLVDFVFVLLTTFGAEFLRRIFARYCCKCNNKDQEEGHKPEFDIARNTMDLIQSQVLTWIGMFYAPLLIFICIIKIVITFYVKQISVMMNCRPSAKPWRAGLLPTVFIGCLLFIFLLTFGSLIYSIAVNKPSAACGPYQGQDRIWEVVSILISDLGSAGNVLLRIITFIISPGTIAAILLILLLFVFYFQEITKGRKLLIRQLRNQINVEGQDKRFLLKQLQDKIEKLPEEERKRFKRSLVTKASEKGNSNLAAAIGDTESQLANGETSAPAVVNEGASTSTGNDHSDDTW